MFAEQEDAWVYFAHCTEICQKCSQMATAILKIAKLNIYFLDLARKK
jgi:hypothetical protein